MAKIEISEVIDYVENNIGVFHAKRLAGLGRLKLTAVLKRKNPYLFKAKNMLTAEQIVRGLVDAHLTSNEETVFGDWLEGLAIFINGKVYGGRKSGITGIDMEFENADKKYIVAIKSGPNWGNSSQIAKMKSDFVAAQKTLRTSNSRLHVIAVNGCCYGKDNNPDKGSYYKYCGQRFWEFISGESDLFTKIIAPLGHQAKERNGEFMVAYAQMINKFTKQFAQDFCQDDGAIDWDMLVWLNARKE